MIMKQSQIGINCQSFNFHSLNIIYYFRMLCAGYPEGGKSPCHYDGGGPLVEGSTIVGLASWGVGCALPNWPGVYGDVGALRDWITLATGI